MVVAGQGSGVSIEFVTQFEFCKVGQAGHSVSVFTESIRDKLSFDIGEPFASQGGI